MSRKNEKSVETHTAENRAREAARNDEYKLDIESDNRKITEAHARVKETYKNAVITDPQRPDQMAQTLSEKFQALKFIVSYQSGRRSIFAEPVLQLEDSTVVYNIEARAQRAKDARSKGEGLWPQAAIVESYARGLQEGLSKAGDVEALKKENDALKRELGYGRVMAGGPWGPFSPWGR